MRWRDLQPKGRVYKTDEGEIRREMCEIYSYVKVMLGFILMQHERDVFYHVRSENNTST